MLLISLLCQSELRINRMAYHGTSYWVTPGSKSSDYVYLLISVFLDSSSKSTWICHFWHLFTYTIWQPFYLKDNSSLLTQSTPNWQSDPDFWLFYLQISWFLFLIQKYFIVVERTSWKDQVINSPQMWKDFSGNLCFIKNEIMTHQTEFNLWSPMCLRGTFIPFTFGLKEKKERKM